MEYNICNETSICMCNTSDYCTNSFDEFLKCKNYNTFQKLHPFINNQNLNDSDIKLNFKIDMNRDIKLIKLFLNFCANTSIKKNKMIVCIIIFELVFNNSSLVQTNKNFENTIRKKIHTLIKENLNEFDELSKYNHNINSLVTIKRLFDLYFPEK